MKTLSLILVGMIGLASVAGTAYLHFNDGGLIQALRDRDEALQGLSEEERKQSLENFAENVKARAEMLRKEKEAEENKNNKTTTNPMFLPGMGSGQPVIPKENFSSSMTLIREASLAAVEQMNKGAKGWKNGFETDAFRQALSETKVFYQRALKNWSSLSADERSRLKSDEKQLYSGTAAKFLGGNNTYSLASSRDQKVNRLAKEVRDAHFNFLEKTK